MERPIALGLTSALKSIAVVAALALSMAILAPSALAQGAGKDNRRAPPANAASGSGSFGPALPAPPRPYSTLLPSPNTSIGTGAAATPTTSMLTLSTNLASPSMLSINSVATPTNHYAGAPGSDPNRDTLVLYDNTGTWAWLGQAYAVMAGQLASHGSAYTLQPVANYVAGELNNYTGLIYIGSTYDQPLPTAFLDDVLATSKPVLWMNDNIWQLAQHATDFTAQYGWTPMYFDYSNLTTVTYKGVNLERSPLSVPSGLLQTVIVDPSKAQAIATASDGTGYTTPWAVRSGNFTYIGEVPFSYVGMNDRYLAATDLIGNVSNPNMPTRKRALLRIEDVSAVSTDPRRLRRIANYLHSRNVPFSVAVIPLYKDPNGYYNNGVPVTAPLSSDKRMVSALQHMQDMGGSILMEGYTHQYSNVDNPYSGVSGDDFEFYRSHISPDNYVIYDTPPAEDSATWAQDRLTNGLAEFAKAGFAPTIFEFPHYAGSAIDYQVVQQQFGVRYDRGLYAAGWCPDGYCGAGTPDYTRIYGQYFPFLVRDIFGSIVLPESLGDVEPQEYNHHPPRSPQDILYSANLDTVIDDNVESFFFDPSLPLSDLKTIVQGIQGMGYQFVSMDTLKNG